MQAVRFFGISGIGWLIDFTIFLLLTECGGMKVVYANMSSSVPAITFVFVISTHKIFTTRPNGLPLWRKYAIYILYQIALVLVVSWIGEGLYHLLSETTIMSTALFAHNLKLICKILITPVTMTANFIVMKVLSEKL